MFSSNGGCVALMKKVCKTTNKQSNALCPRYCPLILCLNAFVSLLVNLIGVLEPSVCMCRIRQQHDSEVIA